MTVKDKTGDVGADCEGLECRREEMKPARYSRSSKNIALLTVVSLDVGT